MLLELVVVGIVLFLFFLLGVQHLSKVAALACTTPFFFLRMLNFFEPAERLELNFVSVDELVEFKGVQFPLLFFILDRGEFLFSIHVIGDGRFFYFVNAKPFAL